MEVFVRNGFQRTRHLQEKLIRFAVMCCPVRQSIKLLIEALMKSTLPWNAIRRAIGAERACG